MSLSREFSKSAGRSVIKLNSPTRRLEVVDYRRFLEEITNEYAVEGEIRVPEPVHAPAVGNGAGVPRMAEDRGGEDEKSALTIAFEKGFEAGKMDSAKVLQAEFDRKLQETIKGFDALVQGFSEEVKRYDQDFDNAVVTLAIAIARRIVARDIDIEGAVLTRLREALKKIIGVEKVKIHVSPADEEYIREHRNNLGTYADSVREIAIEPDEKVERGGCIIESELGNIDARVSTQFELVEEALIGLIKR